MIMFCEGSKFSIVPRRVLHGCWEVIGGPEDVLPNAGRFHAGRWEATQAAPYLKVHGTYEPIIAVRRTALITMLGHLRGS